MNTRAKNSRTISKAKQWLESQLPDHRVLRTTGSDSLCDLVAISPKEVWLLHIVTNDGGQGSDADKERNWFACPDNCRIGVLRWRDGENTPQVTWLPKASYRKFQQPDGTVVTERTQITFIPAKKPNRK